MKVCQVVINSVSHDARVLKEAEAVQEAGFQVVVVGIQDANDSTPIQFLESGAVVRRVAWQAIASRPPLWTYILRVVLFLALVVVGWWLLHWIIGNIESLISLFSPTKLIALILIFASLLYFSFNWKAYSRRRRTYLKIKKNESDEILKYQAEFRKYHDQIRGGTTKDSSATEQHVPQRKRHTKLHEIKREVKGVLERSIPRPLLSGIIAALKPANIRRWQVIFARENKVLEVLCEESPRIVHAHDLSALPVAARYAKQFGAKLIFDAHEIYDHLAQSEDELSNINAKLLSKYSAAVNLFITINDSIASYYSNTYRSLPKALVIKNATRRVDEFTYDGRLHAAAGLPRDTKIVLYQGGFAPRRGLVQLLLAAEHIGPEWSLVFMGWGRLEEELRRIADSLKMKDPSLANRIIFVPKVKQSELPYWTAGAALGVIPYENTGLNHWYCNPNKLWEYPNAGVPILASPFPELRKTIEENQIGWLLPEPLSPRAIGLTIRTLSDADLTHASNNCRRFIQRDNWTKYASLLKNAYGELK